MVGDWMVEQVVHFRMCHNLNGDRRSSLLSLLLSPAELEGVKYKKLEITQAALEG
jgi:hypothetical protein